MGDQLYLGHIVEAIDRILSYASAGENFQVLGDAAKNVSAELRAAHREVPWKDVTGLRDRVVHDYFGISLTIVWDVITNHLPSLRKSVSRLVEKRP